MIPLAEMQMSMDLGRLYSNRFPEHELQQKDAIWRVLCRDFFQRYIPRDAVVLDLGAGYGEFLRNIECGARVAVDLNDDVRRYVPAETRVILAPSHALQDVLADESIDIVFVSNFFEHLPDTATFLATLGEIRTVLKPGGRLLALQPNIRFVGGAYWDFVDHHLALTDRTLVEACTSLGYEIVEVVPKFLPYTTRSALPQSPWLVRAYLSFRPAWWLLGKQTWFVARKPR